MEQNKSKKVSNNLPDFLFLASQSVHVFNELEPN